MKKANREIEVRFLEINPQEIIEKLNSLGAADQGEDLFTEIIFYDKDLKWQYQEKKIVRLRKNNQGIFLAFKQLIEKSADGTVEVEFKVEDLEKAKQFLKEIGLVDFRHQEKKRHSFKLDKVSVDIDIFPANIPPLVELEGESELELKEAVKKIGLDWKDVCMESTRYLIENRYKIPVSKLKFFTFNKVA
ncbi:CYTH domain-containing protein [Candidatus Daviesbacteria bacterium]|nr:CYTH domain-containing protein [Candidatus Daviesbacteria bacterium]